MGTTLIRYAIEPTLMTRVSAPVVVIKRVLGINRIFFLRRQG